MPSNDYVRIKTDALPVGSRLGHPINDDEDRLLLAAGAPITSTIKQRLLSRGITHVLVHPDDAAALRGKRKQPRPSTKGPTSTQSSTGGKAAPTSRPSSDAAELETQVAALAARVSLTVKITDQAMRQRVSAPGCTPYDPSSGTRLAQHFSATTKLLDVLIPQALAGNLRDHRPLAWATENYVTELTDDADHAIASAAEMHGRPPICRTT